VLRHIVMLRFKPESSAETRATVVAGLRGLPSHVPTIRGWTVGENAGVNPDTFDVVLVGEFDDVEGYVAYRDHPFHVEFIRTHTKPNTADRASIQFELDDA
jgi:hypothetical protein